MNKKDEKQITRAIKDAGMGLIGDNVETFNSHDFYNRVIDQCQRYGIYAPSWAKFVELARGIGYSFIDKDNIKLPKSVGLR